MDAENKVEEQQEEQENKITDEEAIERIKMESLRDYESLSGNKVNKSSLIHKVLMIAILILLVLILKTVIDTGNAFKDVQKIDDATITKYVEEDNGIIKSNQNLDNIE